MRDSEGFEEHDESGGEGLTDLVDNSKTYLGNMHRKCLNPLMAMHQTTLECLACKKFSNGSKIHLRHGFEYHMDLNLDIPVSEPPQAPLMGVAAPPQQSRPTIDLRNLFADYFKSEQIEGYCCIKCTIREYLLSHLTPEDRKRATHGAGGDLFLTEDDIEWDLSSVSGKGGKEATEGELKDYRMALDFMREMYGQTNMHEDKFHSIFKKYMKETRNGSEHAPKRQYSTITKSKMILRPPRTLCVHLNRLSYNFEGRLQLNRRKVSFPQELDLS